MLGFLGMCGVAFHGLIHPHHLVGLRPFISLHHVELHLLAFLQTLISLGLDGAVVDEHVGPFVTANKAKSFGVVEPLHDSLELTHLKPHFPYKLALPVPWGSLNLLRTPGDALRI